jgi:hypothetical protein
MANPLAGSDALVSDTFATSPQEFLQTDNLPHLSQGQPKPRIHAWHQGSNDTVVSSGALRQRPVRDDAGPVRRMRHACPKQTEITDLRPKLRGAAFEQRAIASIHFGQARPETWLAALKENAVRKGARQHS